MSELKITVLVEDTVNKRVFSAQHGLAFWIELGDNKVLFDTGPGEIILKNAADMNIDLAEAQAVLLSHGHYDHIAGLSRVLNLAPQAKLFRHSAALEDKYAKMPDGGSAYGGIDPADRGKIQAYENIVLTDGPTEVCEGLWLTGAVPRLTDYEDVGGPFYKDSACTIPDDIIDDQSAYIETSNGTVVILGCAHAGVINTLNYIRQLTGEKPIFMLLGGMHLVNADKNRLEKTIEALKELDIKHYRPCHCTGFAGSSMIYNAFPNKCSPAPVGKVITI